MGRRQFMNLLTFGSVTGVALGALYPVVNYFIPPKAAGSGGGIAAKDELGGNADQWHLRRQSQCSTFCAIARQGLLPWE